MTSVRALLLAFAVSPLATTAIVAAPAGFTTGVAGGGIGVRPAAGGGDDNAPMGQTTSDASGAENQRALDRMSEDKLELIKMVLKETGLDGSAGGGQPRDINQLLSVLGAMKDEPDFPDGGSATSWVSAFLAAAVQESVVTSNSAGGGASDRARLEDILARIFGGNHGGTPPVVIPRNFPHIDAGTHSPIPVTVRGTYLGVVNARTASNTALDGTARFDINAVGFSVDIGGQFDFGGQGVVHLTQEATSRPLGFNRDGGTFLGGTITSTDFTNLGFYGPAAEEFGGGWGFTLTGGSDAGAVTGTLKTAR